MVVGIHGPWGDGKTTVLNLLRADLIADDSIVVRDFNPWRLPDDEAMIRGFFSILAGSIDASLSTRVERARDRAAKWAARLRWLTRLISWLWKPAETVDDLLARFGEAASTGDSVGLEELRNRIVPLLGKSMRRIVVLIDDIDRLDRDETHRLFRLIKACADFPNVCYVLAFDDIAVGRALGERYGGDGELSGRAFLEKIIQVPLKLPVAAREDLRELCFEQVERALAAAGIELSREQIGEFVSGFDRGASIRLTTPRAAKRFGNGLTFALPMLIGEANPVDLLLVESLRAFFPEIYQVVRDNHSDFSGLDPAPDGRGTAYHRPALLLEPPTEAMRSDHAEAAKALVCPHLFPRLGGVYNRITYGRDYLERWSRERRISAPEYTARYFSYAVPRNDVADSKIASIVEAADCRDAAAVASLSRCAAGWAEGPPRHREAPNDRDDTRSGSSRDTRG